MTEKRFSQSSMRSRSKPNAWHMNSTQSGTGSLRPSKIVPVAGVKVLPHEEHLQRRTPPGAAPHRWMGQRSLSYPLKKSASPVSERERWRKSYTLLWLSLTASCAGVSSESAASSQGVQDAEEACHLVPLMADSPCCRGGRQLQGLPITRALPPAAAFWRMAMSGTHYRGCGPAVPARQNQHCARGDFYRFLALPKGKKYRNRRVKFIVLIISYFPHTRIPR